MSYSFTITASSKAEAAAKVSGELAKVVEQQPTHAFDRAGAQAAAEAFISVLDMSIPDRTITVYMSGSLTWHGENTFTHANVSVQASVN